MWLINYSFHTTLHNTNVKITYLVKFCLSLRPSRSSISLCGIDCSLYGCLRTTLTFHVVHVDVTTLSSSQQNECASAVGFRVLLPVLGLHLQLQDTRALPHGELQPLQPGIPLDEGTRWERTWRDSDQPVSAEDGDQELAGRSTYWFRWNSRRCIHFTGSIIT